jgi:hypothetical protein
MKVLILERLLRLGGGEEAFFGVMKLSWVEIGDTERWRRKIGGGESEVWE